MGTFLCNECGKSFTEEAYLYIHQTDIWHLKTYMKVHSGDKPNNCSQCEYASSYASTLRTHLKTHSGEKSNKCYQCDFASSRGDVLRTHLATHSGENQTNATNVNNVKQFRETFENAQWRKVIHMQPMRLCILTGRPFEDSFENPQWRKVKQMQPILRKGSLKSLVECWFSKLGKTGQVSNYTDVSLAQQ